MGFFINHLDYFIKKYTFSNVVLFVLKMFKKTNKKTQLAMKHWTGDCLHFKTYLIAVSKNVRNTQREKNVQVKRSKLLILSTSAPDHQTCCIHTTPCHLQLHLLSSAVRPETCLAAVLFHSSFCWINSLHSGLSA